MSGSIYTDDYGTVPRDLYGFLKARNVTPAEYEDLRAKFGNDAMAVAIFVEQHSIEGSYRAPYPFPSDQRNVRDVPVPLDMPTLEAVYRKVDSIGGTNDMPAAGYDEGWANGWDSACETIIEWLATHGVNPEKETLR